MRGKWLAIILGPKFCTILVWLTFIEIQANPVKNAKRSRKCFYSQLPIIVTGILLLIFLMLSDELQNIVFVSLRSKHFDLGLRVIWLSVFSCLIAIVDLLLFCSFFLNDSSFSIITHGNLIH